MNSDDGRETVVGVGIENKNADDQLASRGTKRMLVDMIGTYDGVQMDPLVHLDGEEFKSDEINEQLDGNSYIILCLSFV